ncbi:hypothetical protein GW17_00052679, partial [Ensete ventricosum]
KDIYFYLNFGTGDGWVDRRTPFSELISQAVKAAYDTIRTACLPACDVLVEHHSLTGMAAQRHPHPAADVRFSSKELEEL